MSKEIQDKYEIYTEIDELDILLGLSKKADKKNYLKPNTTCIIRGEPGAGKTTLGLQILSANLQKRIINENDEFLAVFISLEDESEEIIDKFDKKFPRYTLTEKCKSIGIETIESVISKAKDLHLYAMEKKFETMPFLKEIGNKVVSQNYIGAATDVFFKTARYFNFLELEKKTQKEILDEFDDKKKKNVYDSSNVGLVLIDSLNVFIHLIQKHFPDNPERLVLKYIADLLKKKFPNAVFIFTGEHHYQTANKESVVAESFFCDVSIALFSESITVHGEYNSDFRSPLGTNILKQVPLSSVDSPLKTQSFCRVLKSRNTPNQTRRCSYDIKSKKGFQFFPSYPGDGQLIIFTENEPQMKIWKTFTEKEIPKLYPSLRSSEFDRYSLQRTSAAQRHFRYIPERTDLVLASFDNYWINWYSELCKKWTIVDWIQTDFDCTLDGRKFENQDVKDALREIIKIVNTINANLSESNRYNKKVWDLIQESDFVIQPEIERLQEFEVLQNDDKEETPLAKTKEDLCNGIWDQLTSESCYPCLRCTWVRYILVDIIEKQVLSISALKEILTSIINKTTLQSQSDIAEFIRDSLFFGTGRSFLTPEIQSNSTCVGLSNFERIKNKGDDEFLCFLKPHGVVGDSDTNKTVKCRWSIKVKEYLHQQCFRIVDSEQNVHDDKSEELFEKIIQSIARHLFMNPLELTGCKEFLEMRLVLKDGEINLGNLMEKGRPIFERLNNPRERSRRLYRFLINLLDKDQSQFSMLLPIQKEKIRLFGERNSKILPELRQHKLEERRPIQHMESVYSLHKKNEYVSIPYNANISFIVYKKGLIDAYRRVIKINEEEKKRYKDEILKQLLKNNGVPEDYDCKVNIEEIDNPTLKCPAIDKIDELISDVVEIFIEKNECPQTWEELQALTKRISNLFNTEYKILIETQTIDTCLCTLLEILWGCNGHFRVQPDYTIQEEDETVSTMTAAFSMLDNMFEENLIPRHSSLDYEKRDSVLGEGEDWLFARHWYSTFIDVLTNKDNEQYLWKSPRFGSIKCENETITVERAIDMMPVPISFVNLFIHKEKIDKTSNEPFKNIKHFSCWGDWHFSVMHGSENLELGVDIINNLMSSERICERAFSNSELPTAEAFYKMYKDVSCINIPTVTGIKLPTLTYGELRENYFKHARSRSQVFDYHHCMRELHSVLELIRLGKGSDGRVSVEVIQSHVNDSFKRIKEFISKAFLMH